MNWEFLQSIDLKALFTSLITSATFLGVVTWSLSQLLKTIGLEKKDIARTATAISNAIPEIAKSQKTLDETSKELLDYIKRNNKAEEDYMNLIGVLDEELRGKYKLIDDLKEIIKKYRSED